jgi:formylglycine-generating enzyme
MVAPPRCAGEGCLVIASSAARPHRTCPTASARLAPSVVSVVSVVSFLSLLSLLSFLSFLSLMLALALLAAPATLAASSPQRLAVFETAGPGLPPAVIREPLDAAVRRHLLLTLPAERFTTLMGGPRAPDCTGRCAILRAAEYGAELALAVLLTADPDGQHRLELTVYEAPSGRVRVMRVAITRYLTVLVDLAGRAAADLATALATEGPVHAAPLVDAAADSLAKQAELARWRDLAGPNSLGMAMILVEPGRPFREPPPDQRYVQARPLPAPDAPFLLAATEVTQAQWEAIMGDNPSAFTGSQRPVEQVNWLEAVLFCNALSEREGLTPVYTLGEGSATWNRDADGYRLPTDAEWEYACRAGSLTMFAAGGRIRDLERTAWFAANARGRTRDVATRRPNAWGFHDMHGNVWEWIWDLYASLPDLSPHNLEQHGIGPDRTIRGGSWYTGPIACRTTNFCRIDPIFRSSDLGFRVARSLISGLP